MKRLRLVCKPSPVTTRILVTCGDDEVMRAVLPPPQQAHRRAAPTLCEAVSLWFQQPLFVALFADAQGNSSALGLCDGFGVGVATVHYDVEVIHPEHRRRPLGSFRDLRQLTLRAVK